jgi:photosystem II oxygen-evolving enhancer protein 2
MQSLKMHAPSSNLRTRTALKNTTRRVSVVRATAASSVAVPKTNETAEAQAVQAVQATQATRRSALLAATAFLAASTSGPMQAQAKGGFEVVKDPQDGYQFAFPFGWQEVSVTGQDTVYKDVIEPLESASVSYIPTDKKSIAEYGDVKEVAYTLVRKVLTTVNQDVKLVAAEERTDANGRLYYDFEYTASTPRYTRHALASVTIGNGKFYTLETGSNERRWGKMKDNIAKVQKSFTVFDRQDY